MKEVFAVYEGKFMAQIGMTRADMASNGYQIRRCFCGDRKCHGWEVVKEYKMFNKVIFTRKINH